MVRKLDGKDQHTNSFFVLTDMILETALGRTHLITMRTGPFRSWPSSFSADYFLAFLGRRFASLFFFVR